MKYFILLLASLIFLAACTSNNHSQATYIKGRRIISRKSMVALLFDLHVLEGYMITLKQVNNAYSEKIKDSIYAELSQKPHYSEPAKDSILKVAALKVERVQDSLRQIGEDLYRNIYKKHKTTKERFDISLQYYSHRPTRLDKMYSQVQELIEKEEAQVAKEASQAK